MRLGGSNSRSTLRTIAGGALIGLATALAYLPALGGGFVWDDDAYVASNPLLSEPDGLWRIWFSTHTQSQYFPLVFTTLRLEYAFFGTDPLGYHVVNVLLHGLNALLAWRVLARLAVPGAWLAAAVFALHPVQVESAAWITELKNTQSTALALLSLLAWLKYTEGGTAPNARFYALSLVLYALALLSKTTACTLPAALLLVLWLRGQPIAPRRILEIAPFLALGLAMGLVSIWWEDHLGNYSERYRLSFTWPERLLIATRAIWFYLGKLVWPVDLAFSYPRWDLDARDPAQYLWAVACAALAAALFGWRRALGRGPLAAAAFYVATLSPMLGFISLFTFYYSFVADHYQYLACLGPIALFSAGAWRLGARWPAARSAAAAALLAVLGSLTWQQSRAYESHESLWRDTLRKNPESWMGHNNLGLLLELRGERDEAERHFRKAIALNPRNGEAHFNLANLLLAGRQSEAAIVHYREALQFHPERASFHHNLAVALERQGRWQEAAAAYRESLRLDPGNAAAEARLRVLARDRAAPPPASR
jgi:tetratricopeptide (TPR) repeat protein